MTTMYNMIRKLPHDASVRQSKSHRYLTPKSSTSLSCHTDSESAQHCTPNEPATPQVQAPNIDPRQQQW